MLSFSAAHSAPDSLPHLFLFSSLPLNFFIYTAADSKGISLSFSISPLLLGLQGLHGFALDSSLRTCLEICWRFSHLERCCFATQRRKLHQHSPQRTPEKIYKTVFHFVEHL